MVVFFERIGLGSILRRCTAGGDISGTGNNVGGLVGQNDGGAVTGSYWDMDTSGQSTSDGGTGRTTAQMKQQATFSGWDFTTIWGIFESKTYPLLRSLAICTQSGFPPGDINEDCIFDMVDFVISAQFWLEDWNTLP